MFQEACDVVLRPIGGGTERRLSKLRFMPCDSITLQLQVFDNMIQGLLQAQSQNKILNLRTVLNCLLCRGIP